MGCRRVGVHAGLDQRIRSEARGSSEYALAVTLPIVAGKHVALLPYGAGSFALGDGTVLPPGEHMFPVMSVGAKDEFPRHLERFDEDLWNLAGYDIQLTPATFAMSW